MDAVSPPKAFLGVRFVLLGFRDDDNRRNVMEKLVDGGGVDVGRYGQDCTHVIVDGLVYDDPSCVAARNDGKTVVTGLWVDHSCDIGMAVDATSIMYRPMKDMNGIPGAESLVVCLTGYQRQDRDDIMTMVRLMGAQFSKPLVATRVTHLICYKFEGEKYELAKKMKKIKLVNHQWLEDCLRDWEILPETNYSKSGYELEMEVEAKDSQEEEEDKSLKPCRGNVAKESPDMKPGMSNSSKLPALKELSVVGSPNGHILPTKENQEMSSINAFTIVQLDGSSNVSSVIEAEAGFLPQASTVRNDLPTTPGNAGTSEFDAKFVTLSSPRKTSRRTSISPPGKDKLGNADSTKVISGQADDSFVDKSLAEAPGKTDSDPNQSNTPLKAAAKHIAESKDAFQLQRETEVPSAGSNLPKMNSSCPAGSKLEELEGTILMDEAVGACDMPINELTSLHSVEHEKTDISASKALSSSAGQIASDLPSSDIVSVGSVVNKNDSNRTPQKSSSRLLNHSSCYKHVDQGIDAEQPKYQAHDKCLQPEVMGIPSPGNQEPAVRTIYGVARVDFGEGEKNKVISPRRKNIPVKKTLGAKKNIKKSANVKGSIYLGKGTMESDNRNSPDIRQEVDTMDKSPRADRTEMPCLSGSIPATEKVNDAMQCREVDRLISDEMDDETQGPEETAEPSEENIEGKSDRVKLIKESGIHVEEISEVTNKAVLHNDASDKAKEGPQQNEAEYACEDQLLDGQKPSAQNLKFAEGSKRPLGTRKPKANPVKANIGNNRSQEMETSSCLVKRRIDEKQNNFESYTEVEKENRPVGSFGCSKKGILQAQIFPMKSGRKKRRINKECGEVNPSLKAAAAFSVTKTEPACYILSGHRPQRMQFQKIIRNLKGKLCMHSHRWSYQATHFICPEPVRRTEKFFAACASGRWILKSEYLTASNQEGKFLDEEPYEWHKTGLSQDGAINLEAPRKWRLLRERTGHGALYDMRIIVYGECIAPPLDTLKRVVNAGDGTVLATSPPYTRFLNGKTDYAVICPGMPRVDVWIQEFLKHEIPCIVADYLVEYVCKPGYSLDKHVLYNTHSWAEKSLTRLQSKVEEVTSVPTPDDGESDICCNICGSSDQEEVMLICGDETGSIGCGIATHIDCCDPPLEAVPEEDWLCPKCTQGTKNAKPAKPAAKRKR